MLQHTERRRWRWLLVGALLPGLFLGQLDNAVQHRMPRYIQRYMTGGPRLGFLQWPQDLQAVRYELEIFSQIPEELDPEHSVEEVLYRVMLKSTPTGSCWMKRSCRIWMESCLFSGGSGPTTWTGIPWEAIPSRQSSRTPWNGTCVMHRCPVP